MRPDLGLIRLDDAVERGRVDITLFGQNRFERAHPELHFRQLGAVLMVVVGMSHDTPRKRSGKARIPRPLIQRCRLLFRHEDTKGTKQGGNVKDARIRQGRKGVCARSEESLPQALTADLLARRATPPPSRPLRYLSLPSCSSCFRGEPLILR